MMPSPQARRWVQLGEGEGRIGPSPQARVQLRWVQLGEGLQNSRAITSDKREERGRFGI